jgi:hypothetical protein
MNDNQFYIYHQILLYLQILAKTTPNDYEFEQFNFHSSFEQSRKSFDSGHPTIVTMANANEFISNGEESSTHTINISTKSNTPKQMKSASKRSVKTNLSTKQSSSTDEEKHDLAQLSSSSSNNEEQEIRARHVSDRSSSPSLSSISSELTSLQQSSIINYQHIINSFRDLMGRINVQPSTTNDNNQTQRRGLTKHLLAPSSAGGKIWNYFFFENKIISFSFSSSKSKKYFSNNTSTSFTRFFRR